MKRLTALTALALAALALTAASASADIVTPGTSTPYVGEVAGVNTGPDPTLVTSTTTIVCTGASTGGTIDGNAVAIGELDFGWTGCRIVNGVNCNVANINDVSVIIDEQIEDAPDATIVNTELGSTLIQCATAFNCTASSNPGDGTNLTDYPEGRGSPYPAGTGSEVTARVDGGADPVATISDVVRVTGLGCPTTGTWNAQYLVTVPSAGLASND